MPQGDGTGPTGQGPGTGRGAGGRGGRGRGRMGGDQAGAGPVGECLCPACGTIVPHQRGIPCSNQTCPKYGARLTRK